MPTVATKAKVSVSQSGAVNVAVSPEALYNLQAMQQIQAAVLGKLGCPTCCSGRILTFHQEEGEFGIG